MYCPFCKEDLAEHKGSSCPSCGKDIGFLLSAKGQRPASVDREEELFCEYFSKSNINEGAKELKPGDLIEIFRGIFQHWAVYIGDGYVVHLTAIGNFEGSSGLLSVLSTKGQIKKEKLQTVINNNKWKINNLHEKELKPRPRKEIVKEALSLVGKDMDYKINTWNCEHFATRCRYGKAISRQVVEAVQVGVSGFAGFAASASSFGI